MKKLTRAMKLERVKTGREGGLARSRSLTKARRREIAIKASRAAAKARQIRASSHDK